MFRTLLRHTRAKSGQQWWTPKDTLKSSKSTMTRSEVKVFVYRPLPEEHTVEMEEDYNNIAYVQREYFAPSAREINDPDMVPLAYSESERVAIMERLGKQIETEEQSADRSKTEENNIKGELMMQPSEEGLGPVQGLQYHFGPARTAYATKFENSLPQHPALSEACTILYGCDTPGGRQTWFAAFMRLDDRSLQELGERVANVHEDAKEMEEDPAMAALTEGSPEGPLPNEYVEYAPLYKSYLKYCRGESKTPYADSELGATGLLSLFQERTRWRRLLDKLITGDYDLNEVEKTDAFRMDHQLATLRLFNPKRMEIQREVGARLGPGPKNATPPGLEVTMSPDNPNFTPA